MIKYILIINTQGKIRVSSHFEFMKCEDRVLLEADVARKCLSRTLDQCCFFDYQDTTVVYRHYRNLLVAAGVTPEENELAIYEFIHLIMETLDRYFHDMTEMDILFNLEKVQMVLQEMVVNGRIVGTSIKRNLATISVLDKLSAK